MADVFDAEKRVPPIASLDALLHVLKEVELFRDDREISRAAHMLRQAGLGDGDDGEPGRLMIGVKKLLSVIEMSRQEPDQIVESLVNTLVQLS